METILCSYRISLGLLKRRIEELRMQIKSPQISPADVQALESRRRLLSEEAHDIERIMEAILPYVDAETAAEQAGDCVCA